MGNARRMRWATFTLVTLLATEAAAEWTQAWCRFKDEKSILPKFVPLELSFQAGTNGIFKEINPGKDLEWEIIGVSKTVRFDEPYAAMGNPAKA